MWISATGFATSLVWFAYELWVAFSVKHFDFKSLPIFVIATGVYFAFYVMYYGKTKYKRRVRVIPINKTHGVPEDSQTPVLLKR